MFVTLPLVVRGLEVDLSGRPVLRGVDLEVGDGEIVALLGANGSGKSTLVRAAVGLIPAGGGAVELFGASPTRLSDRRRLGYVPQRTTAQPSVSATIDEVVMSGRLASRRFIGLASRADRRAVSTAIAAVQLQDQRKRRVNELSGGQQQRTLIARALAAEPDILVMDEPTAGVDVESSARLARVLRQFVTAGGAVLLVEHELGPLRSEIDRVVVLDHGLITFSGAPSKLPLDAHGHVHLHPHVHTSAPQDLRPVPAEGVL